MLDYNETLARVVLATGVINISGKRGYTLTSDEQLEIYNLYLLEDISTRSNSIYDLATTYRNVSINREASRIARKIFEASISIKGTLSHSNKDSTVDV